MMIIIPAFSQLTENTFSRQSSTQFGLGEPLKQFFGP